MAHSTLPYVSRHNSTRRNVIITAAVVLVAVIIGYAVVASRAASSYASLEPENGTLSGGAKIAIDNNASGGKYAQFAAPVVPPPTTLSGLLVGMGDSYTSAYGAPPYKSPEEPCYHSQSTAYPQVAAKTLGTSVTVKNVGCSGADTEDVAQSYGDQGAQTSMLAGAKWVAMTIGGNDYDFLGAIEEGTTGPARVVNNASNITAHVKTVLTKVKTAVPNAKIYIFGYPDILPTDASKLSASSCFGSRASKVNLTASHNAYVVLNNAIKSAATASGATYIDAPAAFVGHDMCAATPWIAGLGKDGDEHPNVAGHAKMGELLANAIKAGS